MAKLFVCGKGGHCKETFDTALQLGRHKYQAHGLRGQSRSAKAKRKVPGVLTHSQVAKFERSLPVLGSDLISKSLVSLKKEWAAVNAVIVAVENLHSIQQEA